jgi:hypothetical protein
VFSASWWHITSAEMVGAHQVHLHAANNAPMILDSDWAELVFVAWALQRFPAHHQLTSGTWLPPGWLERAATNYPTKLRRPQLEAAAHLAGGSSGG